MKSVLIFSILCVVAVQSSRRVTYRKVELYNPTIQKQVQECARELNLPVYNDYRIYAVLQFISDFFPGAKSDKVPCWYVCCGRKQSEALGSTLYKSTFQYVKIGRLLYEQKYNVTLESQLSDDDLKSKIDTCYANERNECDYFNCVVGNMLPPRSQFYRHEYGHFIYQYLLNLNIPMIHQSKEIQALIN